MSSKKLNPFKDLQSDQIQRSSRKIFTAHYACRNAALNLTPVTAQATQAHYLWVRASEVIWWEYTRIISVLSDAK